MYVYIYIYLKVNKFPMLSFVFMKIKNCCHFLSCFKRVATVVEI